ncbi:SoxR reducing system RseC family protein [Candidatus Thioglobus sp.]|jgi:sigma-E factor negative regulatory protein RseC|uniref:SoxR reducing system RseC family protein n=1 Tax=Candidatus Thioglobus sp. TaxID=2026721 RepID=UPI001D84C059|nr:SoxR reducing system RseC family protein [Candidatus Thioglobus sp.]MBT3276686.1 SoxR reducing system RseC family protein [Candidatus Thioglobus sp.]MBT3447565.1 SoxR reducing system RseC family protein [Candidatus Thioglobus sp.]MBT3744828.1 SoxR reducing system RseC family protein [Candidatus Thioglobus sp.]MBT4001315.1 SoxR reducing system RseC family protein [Candidatus Thioglobus sp.]MBT4746957.1 SoxR reducing system RseC family protein [Candidatus Thioglobus sp.]
MKEKFEVIEIESDTMVLKVNRSGGCHSCSANSGCGTGILASAFGHATTFNKPLKPGVVVGDFVTMQISSKELFYRAFQLYILPLLALFAGALIAIELFPGNELWQIGFGFTGFMGAMLFTKYFLK